MPDVQKGLVNVEADMAAQLARVREIERNGEFEPIPDIPTATQ